MLPLVAHFRNVSESDKSKAVEELIRNSTPDYDFYVMVVLATLVAAFGLLLDSAAVIIGSMLIAPILFPVLSMALGMVMSDMKVLGRSVNTIVMSSILGILSSALVALFFDPHGGLSAELLARAEPSLMYFLVAAVSGLAVSFALVRPDLSATLPGVAVSVALLPPLSAIGIGLARLNWGIVSGASVLFLINILGIAFASMVSFSLLNLYTKRKVAEHAITQEEARVEREAEKAMALTDTAEEKSA